MYISWTWKYKTYAEGEDDMQVREDKPLQNSNLLKVQMSLQKSKLRRLLLVIQLPMHTLADFRKEQFKQVYCPLMMTKNKLHY